MPSSMYKRPRLAHSEPPPTLPDREISFQRPPFVMSTQNVFLNLNEIMSEVFSYLAPKDVYSCLFVCKAFRRVAFAHLYRHIDLAPTVPTYDPVTRQRRVGERKPIPAKYVELYTRSVEFHQHGHNWCKTIPFLGNIHVRTIFVNNGRHPNHERHAEGNGKHNGLFKCWNCPKNDITADRLVLRPHPLLGRAHVFYLPKTNCPETVVFLRHPPAAVYYSWGSDPRHTRWSRYSTDPEPISNPSRQMTFVFLPQYWDHGFVYTGLHQPKFVEPLKMPQNVSHLVDYIADSIAKNPDHVVTIVGIEHRNPFARPEYWKVNDEREEKWTREVRKQISDRLGSWTKHQLNLRMSTVHIIPFEQYLVGKAWSSEYLSPMLVNRWLNLLRLRPMMDKAHGAKKIPFAKETGFWYATGKREIQAKARKAKAVKAEEEKEEAAGVTGADKVTATKVVNEDQEKEKDEGGEGEGANVDDAPSEAEIIGDCPSP